MQFAKYADLPYTTVKGIFNRGILGASVQNVNKICDILSIDINALIMGEIKPKVEITNLSTHEKEIISAYRNKKEMQPAVDKLLGVSDDEMIAVSVAARSESNRPVEITYISKEKLELIENTKSVEDEVDL